MDWKTAIGTVVPGLAAALGGPLAGAAVSMLADKLLGGSSGDPVADEAKLAGVLAGGITPEIRAQLMAAEQALQVEMVRAGVRKVEVAADVEKAYLEDVADARKNNSNNVWVMRLAVFINAASYVCILIVLCGCFAVLSGRFDSAKVDPGTAAMVGSLVGAAVQWLLSNAAQANGFAFGSSPGSRQMSENLSKVISQPPSAPPVQR